MTKKNATITAEIHNLGYCSEGIGRVIDGEYKDFTVFIENTTIGDIVKAETFSFNKNFLRATLTEIVKEGETRIRPECPISKVCGGCQWQHVSYDTQILIKETVIKDNIKKIANLSPELVRPVISSPNKWNYRSKVQIPADITKNSKRLLIGYYKPKTHEIVNMKFCPVQPAEFDEIIKKLRELHKKFFIEVYNEKTLKGYLRHIILRKNSTNDDILLTFVINSKKIKPNLTSIAETLATEFSNIRGITANINTQNTNVIFGEESITLSGYDHIIESINSYKFKISDKSFFQINPYIAAKMFDFISETIQSKGESKKLIDVYAGVCSISIYVNKLFDNIIAIESEKKCFEDAKENFLLNNVSNISYVNSLASTALKQIDNINDYDWIILDPPRSGCEKEVLEICNSRNKGFLIYTSCNPSTLARDLKILTDHGYELKFVQPFDMFCHTYHIESVSLLEKNG
ncbi:MAG: 23S rRNA (uracil(1939)-C(5))-methyltransferase RlmD [Cyanobacteriota bacterium]